jgi:O-antigen/teichoic acid export membrane protein
MVVSFERLRLHRNRSSSSTAISANHVVLVTFPASFGIALLAPECVHLVLRLIWGGAIIPLQLLAVYSSLSAKHAWL